MSRPKPKARRITVAEAEKLYKKAVGRLPYSRTYSLKDEAERRVEQRSLLREVQYVLDADSLAKAIRYLRRRDWGEADDCARDIRRAAGLTEARGHCPNCGFKLTKGR